MNPDRNWYVIINSHRARILQGLPKPHSPAGLEIVLQAQERHVRGIIAGKPGRAFAPTRNGYRPARQSHQSPQRADQCEFLRDVSEFLNAARSDQSFDKLVLFASPNILGVWREEVPDSLQAKVTREFEKNLVRLPYHSLADAIREALSS
ncbi:host attachment protein [Leisingera sp. ANG59]|uniref:host attachment protein n=1 Tax=Leisingera sp. ANG59 TaxID=2675221 RepID=UPI001574A1C2|nr:host attachment protein [Leisingera sp. ANG59]